MDEISRSLNLTRPLVGFRNPDRTLNSVVLPAPLGPMMHSMLSVAVRSEILSTATSPPKRTLTFSTFNMSGRLHGCAHRTLRSLAVDAPVQQLPDNAAREHQQNHHKEKPVDHLRQRRHRSRAELAAYGDQEFLHNDHDNAAQERAQRGSA